jgi:hypothetical protein
MVESRICQLGLCDFTAARVIGANRGGSSECKNGSLFSPAYLAQFDAFMFYTAT